MLFLVVAHRHMRGAVDKNVRSHQVGIGIEADRGVLAVFPGLVLELRHPVQPAQPRDAVENPGKLRMLRHAALVEDNVLFRVNARRQKRRRHFTRGLCQLFRVLRQRDRMHVHHAVDTVARLLQRHKFADCAEIIAKMQVTGRLNA